MLLALGTLLALSLLALAPAASADIGERIILRCTHGESLSGFSQADYRKALSELLADTEEYSDCSQRIRQAQLAAAGGALGAAGGAANAVPLPATPAEQRAITRAQHVAPSPVKLGGSLVHPGVVHVNIASAINKLPSPLLATLAFLLACVLSVCGRAVHRRLRGRAD